MPWLVFSIIIFKFVGGDTKWLQSRYWDNIIFYSKDFLNIKFWCSAVVVSFIGPYEYLLITIWPNSVVWSAGQVWKWRHLVKRWRHLLKRLHHHILRRWCHPLRRWCYLLRRWRYLFTRWRYFLTWPADCITEFSHTVINRVWPYSYQ